MFEISKDENHKKASTLILEGIELSAREEKYFFDVLNKMHSYFPFDAFVELTLHNDHGFQEFFGKLEIITFEKKFVSEHLGLELYSLLDLLKVDIESQAREWYKDWPMNKFGEIYYSMMKNDSTWRM